MSRDLDNPIHKCLDQGPILKKKKGLKTEKNYIESYSLSNLSTHLSINGRAILISDIILVASQNSCLSRAGWNHFEQEDFFF